LGRTTEKMNTTDDSSRKSDSYLKVIGYLKDSRWQYVAILGFANAISLVRMFVYAKLVAVDDFGIYATLSLIASFFAIIGSLGFATELQRRFPLDARNGNNKDILLGIFQIFTITLVMFCGSSLLCFTNFSFVSASGKYLFAGLAGGLSQLLFNAVTNETRARLLLSKYSNEIMMRNLAMAFGGVLTAYIAHDGYWVMWAETICTLIATAVLCGKFVPQIRLEGFVVILNESIRSLRSYNWRPVLSMMVVGLLTFFILFGERYVSKMYLSIEAFAILSFGLIIPNIGNMTQSILNNLIFTNQVLRFNDEGKTGVVSYSLKISAKFFALLAAVSIPGYFVFEKLVSTFYPNYAAVIPYMPLAFLAFAVRGSDFITNIYVIINKPHYTAIIQAVYLIVISIVILFADRSGLRELRDPVAYFVLNLVGAILPALITLSFNWRLRNN
jgi:O-antigen/teichoic acid export membrane protein